MILKSFRYTHIVILGAWLSYIFPIYSLGQTAYDSPSPTGTPVIQSDKQAIKSESEEKPPVQRKPKMLYGRVEELSISPGATFPVLKALTPKMDLSGARTNIQAQTEKRTYKELGQVITSFPQDYRGIWGGNLTLQQFQIDPTYWRVDPDEANRLQKVFKPGYAGAVNFNFHHDRFGKLSLEPARVTFMVPAQNTRTGEQLAQILGTNGLGNSGNGEIAQLMQQMTSSMTVPIVLIFGEINDPSIVGVSGNRIQASVLSNNIRELQPGVLEQQIVTQQTDRIARTGRSRVSYAESVLRFTRLSANQLRVQAVAVNYGSDKRFEKKCILSGTITRGRTVQTNPYESMDKALQGSGLDGFGDLKKMLEGGNNSMQLPPGFNPLQGLFNQ